MAGCRVELRAQQSRKAACTPGVTFGCHDSSTMWVTGGCRGLFLCRESQLSCGTYLDSPTERHNCSCVDVARRARRVRWQRRICRPANVSDAQCSTFVRSECAKLARTLRRPAHSDAFEPWSVDASLIVKQGPKRLRVDRQSPGWKYHVCGAPPRRSKSWVGGLLAECVRGQSAARQCHTTAAPAARHTLATQRGRRHAPLSPLVRSLLERVAARVIAETAALSEGEGRCAVSPFADMPLPARRLISGAHYQTCAVVGSAPSILLHKLGKEIDAHDVVFRFNFAPTRG